MDSMAAFMMGEVNRGRSMMVFDWDKAARIIRERKASVASAGLSGDWEYTGDTIFEDGKPAEDSGAYLASIWATPELSIDGDIVDCFIMEEQVPESWGKDYADIKWPESALKILAQEL